MIFYVYIYRRENIKDKTHKYGSGKFLYHKIPKK